MAQPVTVIIVNYNSARLLEAALEALGRQTYQAFSTLIVDNGSRERPKISGARVRLVALPDNVGFAAANNRGIAECEGSAWVALLNPDAVPAEDWLEKLVAAAEREPEVASFASRMLQTDQPGLLDGAGDEYRASGRVLRRGHGMPADGRYLEKDEVFSACAAAALYRRDVLEAVGGFDEDYFCYLEDVDLGFRLRLAGHRCLYVPDAVVHHVGSATTGRQSDFAVYHGQRNLVWTYVKNMPGWLFWLCLPFHVAANGYVLARYAAAGRWRVALCAKWHAIEGLPAMWQKRRSIQARRVVTPWQIGAALSKSRKGLRRK